MPLKIFIFVKGNTTKEWSIWIINPFFLTVKDSAVFEDILHIDTISEPQETEYKITYSIRDSAVAGTGDDQYVTIKGTDRETGEQLCDANFNVIGQDVQCIFQSPADIGHYKCISLRSGGKDGIDLIKVIDKRGKLFQ